MMHAHAATASGLSPGGGKLIIPALGAGDGDVSEGGEATATAMGMSRTISVMLMGQGTAAHQTKAAWTWPALTTSVCKIITCLGAGLGEAPLRAGEEMLHRNNGSARQTNTEQTTQPLGCLWHGCMQV